MKNVFQLVSNKVWGGIEQYAYDLSSELKKNGNYVEIVCRKYEPTINHFRQLELPISILPLKGMTDFDSPVRFARLIKRNKNIVHVHNFKDAATAILARHISENNRTRIVLTRHFVKKAKGGMSDAEMERTFSPVHKPIQGKTFAPKNVVVIIIESFGKEYSAWLNRDIDSVNYKGYMPFLDGLMKNSLTYQYSYGNGRKSIDGMPSVLSGIPMFVEPFFLTPASLNKVSSIAGELDKKGYYTAFFHGAPNGSMGFEAFARSVGFKDYYGMTEYENKPGGYNSADYDGTWAIWDDPFMQFYADKMNSFKQPFMTTIFTASSHHPFVIPDQYKSRFPEGNLPIQKCVSYTDMALRNFFVKASHQKWFKNTLFVITADHTNQTARPEYESDLGLFSIPIIFYAPGDTTLAAYRVKSIAQQIDIMPTVLGYLGYDHPYISFGKDLINTAAHNTYAVNYNNGIYQYVKGDYVLQFDGKQTKAIYNYKTDRLMKHNLLGRIHQQVIMEHELKAIIQQYMQRMNTDRLTVK